MTDTHAVPLCCQQDRKACARPARNQILESKLVVSDGCRTLPLHRIQRRTSSMFAKRFSASMRIAPNGTQWHHGTIDTMASFTGHRFRKRCAWCSRPCSSSSQTSQRRGLRRLAWLEARRVGTERMVWAIEAPGEGILNLNVVLGDPFRIRS